MSSVRQSNVLNEPNPFRISEQDLNIFDHNEIVSDINNQGESTRPKNWRRTDNSENARSEWIKGLLVDANDGKEQKKESGEFEHAQPRMSKIMGNIEKYIASKGNQEEKEVLVDFVAKKREIFLLQMSLSIKREEIRKLNVKATAKEEALRNSEAALEKDALKFDLFLKDNDKKAQEAIRLAEKETKRKMDKVQEVKKLNQQLQVVQSSINKYNIGLEECLRFKSFLHALTPQDWIEGQHDEKKKRQRERRRKRIDARRQKWRQEQKEAIALQEKLKIEDDFSKKKRRGRSRRVDCEETQVIKPVERPQSPDFEDEALTSSDEESPMYFEGSNQLLQIFSTLEEENLFLIQNTQEAEQSLDEMTERFEESRAEVQKKADTTLDNINEIKENIVKRQKHLETMKVRMDGKSSGSQNKEQKLMNGLTKSVKQVYQACGFTFAGATPSTLHMLAETETKMERVLSDTSAMPEQEFKRENKAKEKKRRERKRAQQQAEQIRLQEERNRKAIARSLLPPKKVGKKVRHEDALFSVRFWSLPLNSREVFVDYV